jgi:transcriptional regulator with XRE-family HTH domain
MIAMHDLPTLVRTTRERRGIRTQGELAERIGRDTSFVSRLERGAMRELPPPDVVNAMAEALGITVSSILDAAGYDVDMPSDVEFLTVASTDPRARILEIMQGLPDEVVLQWVAALELLTAASSVNTNAGIESPEGNDAHNQSSA